MKTLILLSIMTVSAWANAGASEFKINFGSMIENSLSKRNVLAKHISSRKTAEKIRRSIRGSSEDTISVISVTGDFFNQSNPAVPSRRIDTVREIEREVIEL